MSTIRIFAINIVLFFAVGVTLALAVVPDRVEVLPALDLRQLVVYSLFAEILPLLLLVLLILAALGVFLFRRRRHEQSA